MAKPEAVTSERPVPKNFPVAPTGGADAPLLSISAVERDTGLSKDVLRMWERRYRFPRPLRDQHDERIYPPEQVTKLWAIKRLMDRGFRPGKIISLSLDDLNTPGSAPTDGPAHDSEVESILLLIRTHQLPELRQRLNHLLMKQGLQRFIFETVAPLTAAVGDAWVRGDFAVFEEHLHTEQIQSLLRNAIASAPAHNRAPRVLVTSLPTEQHKPGLLMVEAMLVLAGATCIPLDTEVPATEIVRACAAHRAWQVASPWIDWSATGSAPSGGIRWHRGAMRAGEPFSGAGPTPLRATISTRRCTPARSGGPVTLLYCRRIDQPTKSLAAKPRNSLMVRHLERLPAAELAGMRADAARVPDNLDAL